MSEVPVPGSGRDDPPRDDGATARDADGATDAAAGDRPADRDEEPPAAGPDAVDEPATAAPDAGDGPAGEGEAAGGGGAGAPRRRFGPVDLVVALLLALLGFSLVVQLRTVDTDPTLATARQEDLVRILSDLDSQEGRLRQDIADLEETLGELTTAGQSQEAALEEASERADELGILAGILPAEGPGITIRIFAGSEPIAAATLLDAVQELRGAGAEAIQVAGGDGTAVRVVASTYFVDEGGAVVVDGVTLPGPYILTVIGDPSTLAPALNIPGGVVESVRSSGGTVIVQDEPGVVRVSAVRAPETLQHARPVS